MFFFVLRFPQNCDWPSTVEASPKQSSSENMHMMIVPHSGIVSENNTPMAMSPQGAMMFPIEAQQ